jgi:hypothetical protein
VEIITNPTPSVLELLAKQQTQMRALNYLLAILALDYLLEEGVYGKFN